MNNSPPLFHLMTVGRSVRKGTRGRAVSDLQRFLTEQGFQIEVDGVFGPRTAAAVREFQRRNGIDADGVVGQRTRAVIAQLRQMGDAKPSPMASQYSENAGALVPSIQAMPGQAIPAEPRLSQLGGMQAPRFVPTQSMPPGPPGDASLGDATLPSYPRPPGGIGRHLAPKPFPF